MAHAVTDGARDHMVTVTTPATTVLLGRKNYEGRALLRADGIDELSIMLRPEVPGGAAHLFDDDLPASTWQLQHKTPTESGAICLLYDRVRSN